MAVDAMRSRMAAPRISPLPQLWCSPALAGAAPGADVLHSHGLWVMPNFYAGWIRRSASTELVVSPHGTLSAWTLNHSRWKESWCGLSPRAGRARRRLPARNVRE